MILIAQIFLILLISAIIVLIVLAINVKGITCLLNRHVDLRYILTPLATVRVDIEDEYLNENTISSNEKNIDKALMFIYIFGIRIARIHTY